jgi:hypothetical protein
MSKHGLSVVQLMPAGEAPVLCSRTRDACRLALVVLPPATPPADPPAGAFGPPAANGSTPDAAQPPTSMPPVTLPPATSSVAASTPASQAALGPTQQPISEIVSLEVANSLGAGLGAVVWRRPLRQNCMVHPGHRPHTWQYAQAHVDLFIVTPTRRSSPCVLTSLSMTRS